MEHDAEQRLRRIYKKIGSQITSYEDKFITKCRFNQELTGQMLALDLAVHYDDATYFKDVDIRLVDDVIVECRHHLFEIWMNAKTVNGLEDQAFSYNVTDYLFQDYINNTDNVFTVVKGMSLLHNITTYIAADYPSLVIKHWDFIDKLVKAISPYPFFHIQFIELVFKSLTSTQIYYIIGKLNEREKEILLTTCLMNQNKAIMLDIFDFDSLYQPSDCSIGGFKWDYTDSGSISMVESPNIYIPLFGCASLLNRLYTIANTRNIYMDNIGTVRCLTAGMYAYAMACNTEDHYTCDEMRIPTLSSDILTWFRSCGYHDITSFKEIQSIIELAKGLNATPEEFSRLLALKLGLIKEDETIELPAFDF